MNEREIEIFIAKSLGWQEFDTEKGGAILLGVSPVSYMKQPVPKYLKDLNAINYAELTLSPEEYERFDYYLQLGTSNLSPISAPAHRRAGAYIATIQERIKANSA